MFNQPFIPLLLSFITTYTIVIKQHEQPLAEALSPSYHPVVVFYTKLEKQELRSKTTVATKVNIQFSQISC